MSLKRVLLKNKTFLCISLSFFCIFYLLNSITDVPTSKNCHCSPKQDENRKKTTDLDSLFSSKLIFIGGYARSGTTLMRAILDVHPDVSCGPETKIIPNFLDMLKDLNAKNDLSNAGFNESTIDRAAALFVHNILENHVRKAERLCAKDPEVINHIVFLNRLFPKAKFVFMVRDGRDVAYSLMNILEANKSNTFGQFKNYLYNWNKFNLNNYQMCERIGSERCKIVKYERLVRKPKSTIMEVADFLDLAWTNDFLKHNEFVGSKVVVSDTEWSSNQIKKAIYKSSLSAWKGKIIDYNEDAVKNMAPMLDIFGYEY